MSQTPLSSLTLQRLPITLPWRNRQRLDVLWSPKWWGSAQSSSTLPSLLPFTHSTTHSLNTVYIRAQDVCMFSTPAWKALLGSECWLLGISRISAKMPFLTPVSLRPNSNSQHLAKPLPNTPPCPFLFLFFFICFLNYEGMITHLQETWKIQNKVTYCSMIRYNYFLSR